MSVDSKLSIRRESGVNQLLVLAQEQISLRWAPKGT